MHRSAYPAPPRAARVVLLCAGLLACGPGEQVPPPARDADAGPRGAAVGGGDTAASGPDAASGGGAAADVAPDCDAFAERGLAVTVPTRRAFRDVVGEPTDATRTPVANRHVEGQTDTLVVFERPGLEATYYVLPGRDLLSSVVVRDPRWLRYSAPTIGTPRAGLESMFGPPDAVSETAAGTTLTYPCSPSPGAEEPLQFVLRDGVVTEVRFTQYVD